MAMSWHSLYQTHHGILQDLRVHTANLLSEKVNYSESPLIHAGRVAIIFGFLWRKTLVTGVE